MKQPYEILRGDCVNKLKELPDASVQCCVTSPPYWGLRDYGTAEQLGLESTPEEYVENMVQVFREVHRVLRDDGTLWLNLGDSYCGTGSKGKWKDPKHPEGRNGQVVAVNNKIQGLKQKDLVGIPWRVAFALQADGWYLRQDIIWHKPNPMPESVKDRCTKAHEYIFLLTKNKKYYYDNEAIKEDAKTLPTTRNKHKEGYQADYPKGERFSKGDGVYGKDGKKNKRSVWTIVPKSFKGAHFAVFPPDLIEPCILAGCPEGGTVLDPFAGSGTSLMVAVEHGRHGLGIELNPEYIELAHSRIAPSVNLFTGVNQSTETLDAKEDTNAHNSN